MPELPEVEIVRRGLTPFVQGSTFKTVEVRHVRSVRRNPGSLPDQLQGSLIEHVSRRGKYLWCVLQGPHALVVHLGMSGQFRVYPWVGRKPPVLERDHAHLRILAVLKRPSGELLDLHFLDQRTFGQVHVSPLVSVNTGDTADANEFLPASLTHIARDPLDPFFDVERMVSKVGRSPSEIKRVLLNQTVMSGVGNIYADEALFRSGIRGSRIASDLTAGRVHELVSHVKDVMNESIGEGGTSFDALYVNVNGESGYFSRTLAVYGREGEACTQCGSAIQRISFMNRSSFFCNKCQPATSAVAGP